MQSYAHNLTVSEVKCNAYMVCILIVSHSQTYVCTVLCQHWTMVWLYPLSFWCRAKKEKKTLHLVCFFSSYSPTASVGPKLRM